MHTTLAYITFHNLLLPSYFLTFLQILSSDAGVTIYAQLNQTGPLFIICAEIKEIDALTLLYVGLVYSSICNVRIIILW